MAERLWELINGPEILVLPGVFDEGSTRTVISSKKVKALYMCGACTLASRLGVPDVGLGSLPDTASNATLIAGIDKTLPLIAGVDMGYGNSARTLALYAQGGVAALHVEDKVHSKRCRHPFGKQQLVSLEEYMSRIASMVFERKRIGSNIIIIARTDALQSLGVDEAIRRVKAAIAMGADVAFVEGIKSAEQAEKVVRALAPTPVLVDLPNGTTPNWSAEEAQKLGFKIAIYPCIWREFWQCV
jgi:2-methylisocitrate lyase-like PEP mutase family enzyme